MMTLISSISRFCLLGFVFLVLAFTGHQARAEPVELLVYFAGDAGDVPIYTAAFEKKYSDIKLKFIRSSTGHITARIQSEKENPQNDVIWRLASTSLIGFSKDGLLLPYLPKGTDKLEPKFVDRNNDPPHWVGGSGYMAAICYNTIEAKKLNLPRPVSWKDLLKPIYKGHLAAPNPSASGTGFINMTTWIYLWGEEEGFKYMNALHKNMSFYLNSGTAPCRKSASGEVAIALSWGYGASKLITKGAPIEFLTMKEGMGWDLQGSAIMKNTKHPEAAKKLMDYIVSEDAMRLYNKTFVILGIPAVGKTPPNFPPEAIKTIVDYDFTWNAENRQRLIAKWLDRYAVKVREKKKKK